MAEISDEILDALRHAESGGDDNAVSKVGAMGPYQLMPATARELGVKNSFDPTEARDAAKRYLGKLVDKFGDVEKALIAYNWGPGNVTRKGHEAAPTGSKTYAKKILEDANTREQSKNSLRTESTPPVEASPKPSPWEGAFDQKRRSTDTTQPLGFSKNASVPKGKIDPRPDPAVERARSFSSGMTGIGPETAGGSVTDPETAAQRDAYHTGEAVGIGAMALPFVPSAAKVAGRVAAAGIEEGMQGRGVLKDLMGAAKPFSATGDLGPRVESALGTVLQESPYTLKTLDRLPKNKTEFSKAHIEQEMRRDDVGKAEKEILGKVLAKTEGDNISAKELVKGFQDETKDFELEAKPTDQYADYGLKNIRPNLEDDMMPPGEEGGPVTTLYRLPEHLDISSSNHMNDPRLFGWTRSFDEDGVKHVVEIQSDLAQHMKGPVTDPKVREKLATDFKANEDLHKMLEKERLANYTQPALITKIREEAERLGWGNTHNLSNLWDSVGARLQELDLKLNGSEGSDKTGPLLKKWPNRLIREELGKSAQEGHDKVRFATADTVAKVERWPEAQWKQEVAQTQRMLDRGINRNGVPYTETQRAELEKDLAWQKEQDTGRFSDKGHQSIYDRYKTDIEKYLRKQGGKEVTDQHGHTWLEVPTEGHKGPTQMFAGGVALAAGSVPQEGKAMDKAPTAEELLSAYENSPEAQSVDQIPSPSAEELLRAVELSPGAEDDYAPRTNKERSLWEKARGVGETGLHYATGMAAAPLVAGSNFAEAAGAGPNNPAAKAAQAVTYQPKSEVGKDYTAATDRAIQGSGVAGLGGVSDMLSIGAADAASAAQARLKGTSLPIKSNEEVRVGLTRKQAENARLDATRKAAQDKGLISPAESGMRKTTSDLLKADPAVSAYNEVRATELAAEDLGIPRGVSLVDELKNKAQTYYQAYDDIVNPEKTHITQLTKGVDDYKASLKTVLAVMKKDRERQPGIYGKLDGAISLLEDQIKTKDFNPTETLKDIKVLRENATKIYRRTERSLLDEETAAANKFVAGELEGLFETNLADKPELMVAFRDARKQLAKIHVVEDSINPGNGRLDIQTLAKIGKKIKLDGNLKVIADFGSTPEFRTGVQRGQGGAPVITRFDAIAGGLAAMGGHAPLGAAVFGGKILAPILARKGVFQYKPDYEMGKTRRLTEKAGSIGIDSGTIPMRAAGQEEEDHWKRPLSMEGK